jgi:hypothetical protein
MLGYVDVEMEEHDDWMRGEFIKFGAPVALAVCVSLKGPEVFLLDLAGLWKYANIGKDHVMPLNPLQTGMDLTRAPQVVAPLIGEFKGELGTRHHTTC